MPAILKQRNFFVTKRFEITDNSLKVAIKKPLSYIEDEFTFEEITKKVIRKKSPNLFTLVPGIVCLIGVIITVYSHLYEEKGSSIGDILFYIILSAGLLTISAFNFENIINLILSDRRSLAFYANSPSKHEVNDFLELLSSEQKNYFLNRYAKADPYVSAEQLAINLKWLRERNAIDDKELEELRIQILPKPNTSSSMGFKIDPSSN
jgi:hypothetical protein